MQTYLKNFRESGLAACQTDAREIAEALDIDMTLPEKRQRKTSQQFLYEGRDQTQSTPEESFRRDFFLPSVDTTAIGSLNDRFCKLEDVYAMYNFLFSKENMREAMHSEQFEDNRKKLERALHDMHSEDLVMEVRAAVHTFPDHSSISPSDMLDYIFKEQLLDLYGNLCRRVNTSQETYPIQAAQFVSLYRILSLTEFLN